jgi:hypothetical protein
MISISTKLSYMKTIILDFKKIEKKLKIIEILSSLTSKYISKLL